jgi:hypothetical protein
MKIWLSFFCFGYTLQKWKFKKRGNFNFVNKEAVNAKKINIFKSYETFDSSKSYETFDSFKIFVCIEIQRKFENNKTKQAKFIFLL